MLTSNVGMSKSSRVIAALLLISSLVLLAGCNHFRTRRSTTFASHKATVDRHGVTHRFGVENRGQLDILHYEGDNLNGDRLTVTIENDKVTVNDKEVGNLKRGDTIHIGDDGLTVNSLDYGQTTKYLEANAKQETAQRVDK